MSLNWADNRHEVIPRSKPGERKTHSKWQKRSLGSQGLMTANGDMKRTRAPAVDGAAHKSRIESRSACLLCPAVHVSKHADLDSIRDL